MWQLAQSGHPLLQYTCPLSGIKQTSLLHRKMSANDPKQTSRVQCENVSF